MYTLNIRNLNWITFRNSGCFLSCILLFACSSTKQINTNNFTENNYFIEYNEDNQQRERFYNVNPSLVDSSISQNFHSSDHLLMMMLLNRPITTDQAMMIALEKERINYTQSISNYGVAIRGDNSVDKQNYRANNRYTDLILQDINAVSIVAPN